MPVILQSLGLEKVFDDDKLILGWFGDSIKKGRILPSYTGNFYTHAKYGAVEIYTSCIAKKNEEKTLYIDHGDIHVGGSCVWDLLYKDMKLDNNSIDNMSRLCAFTSSTGDGLLTMHLINSDILPSFLEDDKIKAQVIAFALNVNYYKDEDSLADTIPEYDGENIEEFKGKKILPQIGSIFPGGLLHGHGINEDGSFRQDSSNDDVVIITGIVKTAFVKELVLDEDKDAVIKFIATRIDTNFGELDLVHSIDMISEDDVDLIKEGAIVQATAVLSGDVAIYEYENGLVKDHKNDLAALRYVLLKGNASRLKLIMADDVVYESVNAKSLYKGKENVINHMNYVHENTESKYFAFLATLETDNPGERCIVLAENNEDNLTGIVRITINGEGLISRIIVTNDSSIRFKIDEALAYTEDLL